MKTMMKTVSSLMWLTVFWICYYSAQAAPVESDKGKDEFVFLLPAGNGPSNLFSGVSTNLQPPAMDSYRTAKDSYGNPVSPFGVKDVNIAELQFEIPSYASGITGISKPTIELLPPLTSGEVPADALHIPAVDQPPVDLLPPIGNENLFPSNSPEDVKINEITDRLDGSLESNAKDNVHDSKDKEEKIETKTPAEHSEQETYEGEKYTGGFGGPPGILGEQKERGYAIKDEDDEKEKESSGKENSNDKKNLETLNEASPQTSFPTPDTQSSEYSANTQSPITVFNSDLNSDVTQTNTPDEVKPTSEILSNSKQITTSAQEHNPSSLNLDASLSGLLPPPIPTDISPFQASHSPSERFGSEKDFQPTQGLLPELPFQVSVSTSERLGSEKDFQQPIQQTQGLFPDSPLQISTSPTEKLSSDKDSQQPVQPIQGLFPDTPLQIPPSISGGFVTETDFQQPIQSTQGLFPNTPLQIPPSISGGFASETNFQQPIQPIQGLFPNSPLQISASPTERLGQPIQPTQESLPNSPIQDSSSFSERFGPEKDYQQPIQPTQGSFPIPSNFPNSIGQNIPQNSQPNAEADVLLKGSPFAVQSTYSGIGSYEGGFGGAPGVLGNQNKPGYAVQPDGSIKDPDHTYRPPVGGAIPVITIQTTAQPPAPAPALGPSHNPVATPVIYEKYTGGFGGPPGILTPFDKH